MFWIGLAVGLFVGAALGMFFIALMVASRERERAGSA